METASVVMGPPLWAALWVRASHHRALPGSRGEGAGLFKLPQEQGTQTGTRVSQFQGWGLNSKGRCWEMQTVGRKGRQELSSEGRERGSKDWSGASGAVVAGGSPAGSGARRQQEWLQGVDRTPGCVLPARGGGRGCVLRMALLKDLLLVETWWGPSVPSVCGSGSVESPTSSPSPPSPTDTRRAGEG